MIFYLLTKFIIEPNFDPKEDTVHLFSSSKKLSREDLEMHEHGKEIFIENKNEEHSGFSLIIVRTGKALFSEKNIELNSEL